MSIKSLLAAAALGAALSAAHASVAANLLQNGSFETGDLTGWTNTGNLGWTSVTTSGFGAQDGVYSLYVGPVGSQGFISQTFGTVAGELLTISGWIAGNGTGSVDFYFNGVDRLTVNPAHPYTQYAFTAVATGHDTFTVGYRDDPSYLGLDNFSVVGSGGAVPEPATWALMIGGFGLAGATLRRRRLAIA